MTNQQLEKQFNERVGELKLLHNILFRIWRMMNMTREFRVRGFDTMEELEEWEINNREKRINSTASSYMTEIIKLLINKNDDLLFYLLLVYQKLQHLLDSYLYHIL